MHTKPVTFARLAASVIAVPPLARNDDLSLNCEENKRLIRYLESGGITTLLYGGNANFYHVRLSEYSEILEFLAETAATGTLVIPSAGPAFGTMMDQAAILRKTRFPTVMILPQSGMTTSEGVETGVRRFVEAVEKPVVLYIKDENFITPMGARRLFDDGLISWIKYAVVRAAPARDPVLTELVDLVDPNVVISGMGEQPAITHLRHFGLAGFTSGCVCLNPALSSRMLRAIQAGEFETAEAVREVFRPLEDLRNAISPVCALHDAVSLAGIAQMGPVLPLLSNLHHENLTAVKAAAEALMAFGPAIAG